MKKILLLLTVLAMFGSSVRAQSDAGQQLQNNGFEQWTTETSWKSWGVTHTANAPTHWHSICTATGSLVGTARDEGFVTRSTDKHGGSYSVKLTSITKYVVVTANGSLTSGRFHAGSTSASAPSNCTYTSTESGYQASITAYPDSVYIWAKTKNTNFSAHMKLVLHNNVAASNNAICQDPNPSGNDNGVVGTSAADNQAKVVATATNSSISSTSWTQIKAPFVYTSNNTTPSYMLVTLSTNATAGGGSAGDWVLFDDIVLIYNTRLASITVNNSALAGFNPNTNTYNYGEISATDLASLDISASCQSAHASASVTHSPTVHAPYATIRVEHLNQETTVYRDYTINFTIVAGCETTYGVDEKTACGSYTWHGTTYTESTNTPTYTLQNVAGCDSIVTLHLTINQPTTGDTNAVACGSYTWHGTTYTASTDEPTYTLQNAAGCDSIVTLHLTINQPTTGDTNAVACGNFVWNGNTYNQSGEYSKTVTNTAGCDSTVTLHLTINNPLHASETKSACGSYTWNGTTYSQSGNYTYSHQDANGCTQGDRLEERRGRAKRRARGAAGR